MAKFQSTPPARGATVYNDDVVPHMEISIHAPREGGDGTRPCKAVHFVYFNPRPPRGGRRRFKVAFSWLWEAYFNPRPPRGGRRKAVSCIC